MRVNIKSSVKDPSPMRLIQPHKNGVEFENRLPNHNARRMTMLEVGGFTSPTNDIEFKAPSEFFALVLEEHQQIEKLSVIKDEESPGQMTSEGQERYLNYVTFRGAEVGETYTLRLHRGNVTDPAKASFAKVSLLELYN